MISPANTNTFAAQFYTLNSRAIGRTCSALLMGAVLIGSVAEAQLTCNGATVTIAGTSEDNRLEGTSGNDVIHGLGGNDIINGLGGDDVICGGDGDDELSGGSGADQVFGERGEDVIEGDEGDDALLGGWDNDKIFGGPDNDYLVGGPGEDDLRGGRGDDVLRGGPGKDRLYGARGNDTTIPAGGRDHIRFGPEPSRSITHIAVSGNRLVNQNDDTVVLRGVNRSGAEYACIQGWGMFDADRRNKAHSDSNRLMNTMDSWGINVVRVPINEHCWLGTERVPELQAAVANGDLEADYLGANYRKAVGAYVRRLNKRNMVVILDMHFSNPAGGLALDNIEMANADYSAAFWQSVAGYFADNTMVIFDLVNEPHDLSWECLRDGCVMEAGWTAAGMQSLVDAIRSTGSKHPLMIGGLAYANDMSRWLDYMPSDPANSLIASFHMYNFNINCINQRCWDTTLLEIVRRVPLIAGEIGQDNCGGKFVDGFYTWADRQGVSYVGWTWNPWSPGPCGGTPTVIDNWYGPATNQGVSLYNHLQPFR